MPKWTPALRLAIGLVVAVGIAGTATLAANRAERLTAAEVVGLYRVEPAVRGNPTTPMLLQRFSADGRTRIEAVHLLDEPAGLRTEVRVDSARTQGWTVEDGRLCIATTPEPACSSVARDPVTGDLTVGSQRLTRIRSSTLVD